MSLFSSKRFHLAKMTFKGLMLLLHLRTAPYVEYYCDSLDKPKSLLCYCKTDMEKIGKEGSSKQEELEQDGEKPEHVTAMMTTTTTLTRCACMPFYILMKNTQAK